MISAHGAAAIHDVSKTSQVPGLTGHLVRLEPQYEAEFAGFKDDQDEGLNSENSENSVNPASDKGNNSLNQDGPMHLTRLSGSAIMV